jgi:hypothetical protein
MNNQNASDLAFAFDLMPVPLQSEQKCPNIEPRPQHAGHSSSIFIVKPFRLFDVRLNVPRRATPIEAYANSIANASQVCYPTVLRVRRYTSPTLRRLVRATLHFDK